MLPQSKEVKARLCCRSPKPGADTVQSGARCPRPVADSGLQIEGWGRTRLRSRLRSGQKQAQKAAALLPQSKEVKAAALLPQSKARRYWQAAGCRLHDGMVKDAPFSEAAGKSHCAPDFLPD